ncbi:M24 family metallopeptidase [Rhizobium paknamense]|uniref:Xaa-Pro dipeptidase n=1 Tax=Rhizobium paknamense TaxID=1206817 RepID=A0ABU0I8G6_9HYPH|nr:Xaa-Pro peptidase family protein [Rhizobium paknamense]MDQ0454518.1 Xaa-Pro dipeptidase [Rhizobium paknamense]
MMLHFAREEYDTRLGRLTARMREDKLDAMLLFAQESMYWLTGYDSFGYCFFQTLVVKANGEMALLTRSPDLRQARLTSIIENIVIWVDRTNADPSMDLKNLLSDMDLLGCRIGVEYDTHGMTGRTARLVDNQLLSFGELIDASSLVSDLRLIKSPAEMAHIQRAAELADDALDAALPLIRADADEAAILSAMQAAVLKGGGDYPAHGFILGSGEEALLCRYTSSRRRLGARDQLTLEWAGVHAHYHAAMRRTVLIGEPTSRHLELYEAALATLQAMEGKLRPGQTFAEIFEIQARMLDDSGLTRHRLNACGYSLGARFAPTWMEPQMFMAGNSQPIAPNMALFLHVILLDSDRNAAMTLGQTYLTTEEAPKALSRHSLDLLLR